MTRAVRVLHVIDSFDLGGGQTALWNLLRFIDRRRFACEVAAMHGTGRFYHRFQELDLPVHSLAAHKFSPTHLFRIFRMAGQFDITHFHLFGSNWLGKPAAALGGCRIRFNHDQCNDAFRADSRCRTELDRLTNHLSTRICAVSESTRRFLCDVERLPPGKVSLLPNPVDTAYFRPPSGSERAEARHSLGMDPEAFQILCVGRLHPQKNLPAALEAVSRLGPTPRWQCLFAGTGPEEKALRNQARQLGIADRVRFLGHQEHTRELYRAGDALLMPSHYEGLPMVLLEAVSCGLAVVGSGVDGIAETLRHEETGLLAAPSAVDQHARHLQRLMENPGFARELGRKGRETIIARFEVRTIARQLEALYSEALAKGS